MLTAALAAAAIAAGTTAASPIVPPVSFCIKGGTVTFSDTNDLFLGAPVGSAGIAFLTRKAQTTGFFEIVNPDGSRTRVTVALGACANRAVPTPGAAYLCGAGYGPTSVPDDVTGPAAIKAYLSYPGNHYAVFVQGPANGPQPAQQPGGSFYCVPPPGAKPILDQNGKQLLADTNGWLYSASYANGETIGHLAYSLG